MNVGFIKAKEGVGEGSSPLDQKNESVTKILENVKASFIYVFIYWWFHLKLKNIVLCSNF